MIMSKVVKARARARVVKVERWGWRVLIARLWVARYNSSLLLYSTLFF